MPTWLAIVLVAIAALILLFLAGGVLAVRRRDARGGSTMLADIAQANEALALARAQDRGWDRDAIDVAGRAAHLKDRPTAAITAVHLVQVIDRPGTDDDEAHVRIDDDAGVHEIHLVRRGDDWVAAPAT